MADPDKKTTEASSQPPAATTVTAQQAAAVGDDSDPDFDDLDDVLDQFSANAPSQQKTAVSRPPSQPIIPIASGPDRPSDTAKPPITQDDLPVPAGQKPDESEEEFIERLSKEMSSMFSAFGNDPSKQVQSPEDIAKMGKELEEFTTKMEQEGIQPEDLLKALLGQEESEKIVGLAKAERDKQDGAEAQSSSSQQPPSPKSPQTSTSSSSSKPAPKSFEDTIRSTMSRLGESDKSATTATQKSSTKKSEEDMLADMLRALEGGPGSASGDPNGDDGGLSKMFMDMMQQLTHKDLLYEPMKELHTQYPAWLDANKSKLDQREFERYSRQSAIVADITRKFEEPSFNDDDPACKEFVWEKMQKMQEEGAPPEELVKNPFPGTDFGGIPGLGGGGGAGGGELPENLEKELEEGCATQ